MNRTTAFGRKIVYLLVLVGMLVPLFLLGQPAGGDTDSGGQLAQMRDQFNIAESDLGEISPASETMKLASLGLRGVAATLLWNKAHEYRVRNEWDRLKATLNNIALLQPHFEKVWEFQAWNLSYNVSAEFDDYRQRYEMVREGTEFLTRGVRQNRNASRLIWYTGWFYGQKIGMSDEKTQFRRLFAEDDVLHERLLEENIAVDSPEARGPLGKPDNWLVGRLWLNKGYDLVDSGVEIRRQTPLNFYATGPKWRIKHAEAIEREGILDERTQDAWQRAAEDWRQYGNRSIPTTSPFTIKLDQIDELRRQIEEKVEEFEELAGDVFEAARQEKIDALPADQKAVWDKPESQRSEDDQQMIESIEGKITPHLATIARKLPAGKRLRAITLVGELADLNARAQKTDSYRNQTNYPYWKTLAQAEQEERTVLARRLIYQAEQANAEAELDKAIELYEQAFVIWAEIFDDYPILTVDDSAEDLYESIKRYFVAIDSEEIPEDFPLKTFVEMMGEGGRIDAGAYQQMRDVQQAKSEQRQEELEQQERERAEAAASAEADSKPETDSDTGTDSEPEAGDEPEMEGEPEAGSDPETGSDPESTEPEAGDDDDAPAADVSEIPVTGEGPPAEVESPEGSADAAATSEDESSEDSADEADESASQEASPS